MSENYYVEDKKIYMKEDFDIFKNFVFDAPDEGESNRIKAWIAAHRKVCKESNRYYTMIGQTAFAITCVPAFKVGREFIVECTVCKASKPVTNI